jgi:AraC family transcriptional regulator of adaptative response/methylated-DNA-[protein]-cysteine methyltransferase
LSGAQFVEETANMREARDLDAHVIEAHDAPLATTTPVGAPLRLALRASSLGWVAIATQGDVIRGIFLGDAPDALREAFGERFREMPPAAPDAACDRLADAVVALVEAPHAPINLPMDPRGTPFQSRVWTALRAIPPGRTASYAEVARAIGAPNATRAVAAACAANPLAIAIPCHRVVRSDGALSGYRWGVERKRALLGREGARVKA